MTTTEDDTTSRMAQPIDADISEAQVIAWLNARAAELDTDGIGEFHLTMHSGEPDFHTFGANGVDAVRCFHCARGASIADALAALRTQIPSSAARSAVLREKAREMLAEAAKLDGAAT